MYVTNTLAYNTAALIRLKESFTMAAPVFLAPRISVENHLAEWHLAKAETDIP